MTTNRHPQETGSVLLHTNLRNSALFTASKSWTPPRHVRDFPCYHQQQFRFDDPKDTCVGTGPPVGVGIGSLPVTPKINGEIGAMCVESGLAGVAQHNKT